MFCASKHEVEVKLPAVSGSSGRLIVERPKDELSEPDYPGLVFADESLDYGEAVKQFVTASQTKDNQSCQAEMGPAEVEKAGLKAKKQALRRNTEALILSRRQIREQRKQEDAAWQVLKSQRRVQQAERKAQPKSGPKSIWLF